MMPDTNYLTESYLHRCPMTCAGLTATPLMRITCSLVPLHRDWQRV